MTSQDWWRGSDLGYCCGSKNHAVPLRAQQVRRRNRARHVELARTEIDEALADRALEVIDGRRARE